MKAKFIREKTENMLYAFGVSFLSTFTGEDRRKFKYAYHCGELEEPVHLHSNSILSTVIPEWVVFQEMYETGSDDKRKMVMSNVTAIEPEWLPACVPNLCNLGNTYFYTNLQHPAEIIPIGL